MAIFGWLVLTGLMLMLSVGWVGLALFTLGQYNIGGVPNSWLKRVVVLVLGAALASGWWFLVIQQSPFTISMKS